MSGKSWLKRAVESLTGDDETPDPPTVFRDMALDFARHNPEATIGDWVELYHRGCQSSWKSGYLAGYAHKLIGIIDQPFPMEQNDAYEAQTPAVDLSKVVPLQEGKHLRNVVFTDDEGLVVDTEDPDGT